VSIYNGSADSVTIWLDVQGWYSTVGSALPHGPVTTQLLATLQATANGGGAWVTYKYRVGTVASFSSVPVGNVNPAPAGSAWPEQSTGSPATFPSHTWNVTATVGSVTNALVQVQACYGQSSSDPNPVCAVPVNVTYSPSTFGDNHATTDVGPGRCRC
jgi:hypothetical protein